VFILIAFIINKAIMISISYQTNMNCLNWNTQCSMGRVREAQLAVRR